MPTVLIWNNNEVTFGHSYPGHAAMNITDIWPRTFVEDDREHYVSWWPEAGSGQSGSHHRAGDAKLNFFQDLVAETYAPDHIIRLPAQISQKRAMITTWKAFRTKGVVMQPFTLNIGPGAGTTVQVRQNETGPSYRFYKKNCSVAVQRVLKSAGFHWPGGKWFHIKSAVWTPLNVKRLALSYTGARTLNWVDFLEELVASGALKNEAFTKLCALQRRTIDHGSSSAAPRNEGQGVKSDYKNDAIVSYLRTL